jgi:hypothetical protein
LIEQQSQNTTKDSVSRFGIYRNKDSKMNESILIHYAPELGTLTLHVYAVIIPDEYFRAANSGGVIDLRKSSKSYLQSSPLKIVGEIKDGSLSFIRYFVKNPAEKKQDEKSKAKNPTKSIRKRYYPPLLLLVAHYCNQYSLPQDSSNEDFVKQIQEITVQFDELIQEEMHPTLRTIGKPLYLKGDANLVNFHQTRDLPEPLVKNLAENKMIQPISKHKSFSILVPVVKGIRKDFSEQKPLTLDYIDTGALSHIVTDTNKLLPINTNRFPLVVVGEPTVRRNLILNILNNSNTRFLIFDPKENYGRLATNPRIRGYVLNKNFTLDIASKENGTISKQVYAFWFGKIIAYITGLKTELSKLIEANYLKIFYDDELNQQLPDNERNFHSFAEGNLLSEGTSSSRRSELSLAKNALYTLGTYKEISQITSVGGFPVFESLFETKGTILQFNKTDEQLTKTAYLFTLLKLRSIVNEDPKIIVLENIDEIIGQNNKYQNNDLSDLILGLAEDYNIILGVRSPAKIMELFKSTKSKFINRLLTNQDRNLLFNEYKISKSDTSKTSRLTEREFLVLVPEFSTPNFIKIESLPDFKMPIIVDKRNVTEKLRARVYSQYQEVAPELQKIIFDLICMLKERSDRAIAEQGLEKLFDESSEVDIYRAKAVALQENFIKKITRESLDSAEKVPHIQLTERGEEFYKGYLRLQDRIPKITFNSLASEKNFEQQIFFKLEECSQKTAKGETKAATVIMEEIIIRLLGAFPQEERFVKGKAATDIMEFWYRLETIHESENYSSVKSILNKFSGVVKNSLKLLKHRLLDDLPSSDSKKEKPLKIVKSKQKPLKNTEEPEYEIDLPTSNSPEELTKTEHWDKQVEIIEMEETEDASSLSLFKDAVSDLKSANIKHLDSNGDVFEPEKGKIFDDDLFENDEDLETFENKLLSSSLEDLPQSDPIDQISRLDSVRKNLMKAIARELDVQEIDDEPFIWHTLKTRFNGKLDDGYTISEVISTLKNLYKDANKGAIISDVALTKLNKLIKAKKFMPKQLIADLKQYIADVA